MSVKEVMDSWTLQTGFPVLTVKRNYQEGTALITQVRGEQLSSPR
jgi:aminopeptidase N